MTPAEVGAYLGVMLPVGGVLLAMVKVTFSLGKTLQAAQARDELQERTIAELLPLRDVVFEFEAFKRRVEQVENVLTRQSRDIARHDRAIAEAKGRRASQGEFGSGNQ